MKPCMIILVGTAVSYPEFLKSSDWLSFRLYGELSLQNEALMVPTLIKINNATSLCYNCSPCGLLSKCLNTVDSNFTTILKKCQR